MKRFSYLATLIFIGLLVQSCDPSYPVSIKNESQSKVIIQAKRTLRFWNDSLEVKNLSDKDWIQFEIEPDKSISCGMTIGGLKNDLPFSELKIFTKSDTIIATSEKQVLQLFDKTFIGNLETPYVITIK